MDPSRFVGGGGAGDVEAFDLQPRLAAKAEDADAVALADVDAVAVTRNVTGRCQSAPLIEVAALGAEDADAVVPEIRDEDLAVRPHGDARRLQQILPPARREAPVGRVDDDLVGAGVGDVQPPVLPEGRGAGIQRRSA
jgi:hypothetical protein